MNKEWPTRSLQSLPLAQGTPSLMYKLSVLLMNHVIADNAGKAAFAAVYEAVAELERENAALSAQVVELQQASMDTLKASDAYKAVLEAERREANSRAETLAAQVVEQRKALLMAKDYLYNSFEPDNQSSTYNKLVAALHSGVTRASVPPSVKDSGT